MSFGYECEKNENKQKQAVLAHFNKQWSRVGHHTHIENKNFSSVVSSALTILRPRVQMTSFNQIKYFVSAFVYLLDIGSGETNEPTV